MLLGLQNASRIAANAQNPNVTNAFIVVAGPGAKETLVPAMVGGAGHVLIALQSTVNPGH